MYPAVQVFSMCSHISCISSQLNGFGAMLAYAFVSSQTSSEFESKLGLARSKCNHFPKYNYSTGYCTYMMQWIHHATSQTFCLFASRETPRGFEVSLARIPGQTKAFTWTRKSDLDSDCNMYCIWLPSLSSLPAKVLVECYPESGQRFEDNLINS